MLIFIGNDVSVSIIGVTVSFSSFGMFFKTSHESVFKTKRLDDFLTDNFMRRFSHDFIDNESCKNEISVDVSPGSAGLEVEASVVGVIFLVAYFNIQNIQKIKTVLASVRFLVGFPDHLTAGVVEFDAETR